MATEHPSDESSAVENVDGSRDFPSEAQYVPIPIQYLPVAEVLRREGHGDTGIATEDFIHKIAELIRQTRRDLTASDVEDKKSTGSVGVKAKLSNALSIIDNVLEFLEMMGPTMLQDWESNRERDAVAQGILSIIEMARLLDLYRFLRILIRFIDVREDPYRAKIKQITKMLENVESRETEIEALVEDAGTILKTIIQEGRLLEVSANLFDNAVREARLRISFNSKTLSEVEAIIQAVKHKASVFKWTSRIVRSTCVAVVCSWLYEQYKNDTIGPSLALGCSMLVTLVILSMYPEKAYTLSESVDDLLVRYQLLFDRLKYLEELIESTQSFKDGLGNDD